MGIGGNWELLSGKKWEWDLSFRWEWEWDGNGNEVIEMGRIWYEKNLFPHSSVVEIRTIASRQLCVTTHGLLLL